MKKNKEELVEVVEEVVEETTEDLQTTFNEDSIDELLEDAVLENGEESEGVENGNENN